MGLFSNKPKKKLKKKNTDAETIAMIVSEQLSTETDRMIEELKQYREPDYEKLADAIVKAQKKYAESDSAISKVMSTLIGIMFYIVSITIGLLSIFVFFAGWYYVLFEDVLQGFISNALFIVFLSLLCFIVFVLGLALFKSAKELEKERDKQFIVAVFSAMMSFSAMVIALISIIK